MLDFLAEAVVVTTLLLLVATVLLFLVGTRGADRLAETPAILAGTAAALAALGVAALIGSSVTHAAFMAGLVGLSVPAWLGVGRAWTAWGLVAWALTIDVGLSYLGYVLVWSLSADLGGWGAAASLVLWALELAVFLIGVGYVWELVDVLSRRRWTSPPQAPRDGAGRIRPFVSLHVPTHNEPPEMVIETLEQLLRQNYDDYEILVVDNNTTDPATWRPLEEFCQLHERLVFIHLEDWPGFKSGALNYALTRTDPRAEVIGIVDADYHVDPDFLETCAPLFGDPTLSFVQTPQDYREWRTSAYFRRLYYSYGYFFDVSQRSRNERNGAIFGGTMGLIRRSELEEVGGWDEWCITEDAELSLRLLRAGGRGVHIPRAFGQGVMPLSFEALKGQRFRWCFGGIQILRLHWRFLLPGRATADNQLTLAQRWAYAVGGLQWFGDLAALLFTGFLVVGALDAILGDGLVVRRLAGFLLVSVVALVVLGAVRSVALVKRSSSATWGEAAGAFGLWLGLGPTVARASWQGLVSKEGTFLRTPKVQGDPSSRDALRGNRPETAAGLLCVGLAAVALVASSHGAWAVGSLLLVQGVGFLMAPLNSLAAIRSDLNEDQRRRRAWRTVASPVSARRAGVLLVGVTLTLGGFLALAAPTQSPLGAGGIGERIPAFDDEPTPTSPPEADPSQEPTQGPSDDSPGTGTDLPGGGGTGGVLDPVAATSSTPGGGAGSGAATSTPGGGQGSPASPGQGQGSPTPPPGQGQSPTSPPGQGQGLPTAPPGQGQGSPTAPPGQGQGSPTAPPGQGQGQGQGQGGSPTAPPGQGHGQSPTRTP